ncbi:hypothetical protein BCT16_17430 [Vibrio sp. 10N.222.54.B6]|nr:hypothetical protein BCU05_12460 [Vibrio sp. 10N.261.54.C3]PMN98006.1 hypothetical protein BCT21_14105 [Vibrio sp. 10N.222.55.F9]PMO03122.1 hypothetical protein BCT20_08950 [Vibrio sp. 10N.222.55.C12]PMO08632.1 hypothetical protein BCT17_20250 [Vibrio sp. 10N.222.54.F10]PMO16008.1 hypothetical protein BCT16_17430 [Vibrio sp. 10N.222.54.B6]TKF39288.1 hypothetical protein FCV57_13085 [Vibrio sp. F13]
MQVRRTKLGDVAVWGARDAWVLRALTEALKAHNFLPISESVIHLPLGATGLTNVMEQIGTQAQQHSFFCRTDIQGCYQNLNKFKLVEWLHKQDLTKSIKRLITQFLFYQVESGGIYINDPRGIPRSCGLSSYILAAIFYELDESLNRLAGVIYYRYMDDFLILAESRWKLKKAIKLLKIEMARWELTLHPDKTAIGRVDKGFDWLGVKFDGNQWSGPSKRSLDKSNEKLRLLSSVYGVDSERVKKFKQGRARWVKWVSKLNR